MSTKRNTIITVPDVSDPIALSNFLTQVVEHLDKVFGVRGTVTQTATLDDLAATATNTTVQDSIEDNKKIGLLQRIEALEAYSHTH